MPRFGLLLNRFRFLNLIGALLKIAARSETEPFFRLGLKSKKTGIFRSMLNQGFLLNLYDSFERNY